jgi:hypothetical protein
MLPVVAKLEGCSKWHGLSTPATEPAPVYMRPDASYMSSSKSNSISVVGAITCAVKGEYSLKLAVIPESFR